MADLEQDRRGGGASSGGFTLAEMLAALAILLFGITALIGALSQSIGERRSSDARLYAAALADRIVHALQDQSLQRRDDADTDLDLQFVRLPEQDGPGPLDAGFPGMTWSVQTVEDPDRIDLWLVRISVSWLEEGENASVQFERVLPRQLPLARRVQRFREENER